MCMPSTGDTTRYMYISRPVSTITRTMSRLVAMSHHMLNYRCEELGLAWEQERYTVTDHPHPVAHGCVMQLITHLQDFLIAHIQCANVVASKLAEGYVGFSMLKQLLVHKGNSGLLTCSRKCLQAEIHKAS